MRLPPCSHACTHASEHHSSARGSPSLSRLLHYPAGGGRGGSVGRHSVASKQACPFVPPGTAAHVQVTTTPAPTVQVCVLHSQAQSSCAKLTGVWRKRGVPGVPRRQDPLAVVSVLSAAVPHHRYAKRQRRAGLAVRLSGRGRLCHGHRPAAALRRSARARSTQTGCG